MHEMGSKSCGHEEEVHTHEVLPEMRASLILYGAFANALAIQVSKLCGCSIVPHSDRIIQLAVLSHKF